MEQEKMYAVNKRVERKHRRVFTRSIYKKWFLSSRIETKPVLDIDEHGVTVWSSSDMSKTGWNDKIMVMGIYQAVDKIFLDDRQFLLKVAMSQNENMPGVVREAVVDLKRLDGDLWANYCAIQETFEKFAKEKLEYKHIHFPDNHTYFS